VLSFQQGFLPMSLALVDVHGFSLETAIESEISELENGIFFEMVIEWAKLSVIEMAAPSAKRNGRKLQFQGASLTLRLTMVLLCELERDSLSSSGLLWTTVARTW